MSATPDLIFNGTRRFHGAGSDAANGVEYMSVIESRYFDPAPIRIDVGFDSGTGAAAATVTMYSSTTNLVDANFHMLLIEDDVPPPTPTSEGANHLTRALYSDTLSLAGTMASQAFSTNFTIDPSWNPAKLQVVAFVQLDDQSIIQAGSSAPKPDFIVRAMVPFSRTEIGTSAGAVESEDITIMNIGLGDTFTVELVVDVVPAGWNAAFKDSSGTAHTGTHTFGMTAEEQTTFTTVITPAGPGYMRYRLVIDSTDPAHLAKPLEIPFVYITDDVDALVVDDDGGESFEDYFTEALTNAGHSYGIWNRGADALTQEVADTFEILVWNVGWSFPSLDEDDKLFLGNYLDSGKALLLSGQDIGWELNDPSPYANPDIVWFQTYLHAAYLGDDSGIHLLNGVSGDPVGDGISIEIQGGSGANNQEYPDEIAAVDADATEILFYQGNGCGAVRSLDSSSGARVVYLGFGFEGVNDSQDRQDLMGAIIAWIGPTIFTDDFEGGDASAWSSVSP